MGAPTVRPAARVLALSGTVATVAGPLPPVVLHGSGVGGVVLLLKPPCAWVSARFAQPTVSNPVVATLLCTAVTPTSAPNRSQVLLAISEPRVPMLFALLLSLPWIE